MHRREHDVGNAASIDVQGGQVDVGVVADDTVERMDGLSSRARDHSLMKLYRITRKHVGSQYGRWLSRVEVFSDKPAAPRSPRSSTGCSGA